jgi:hypothetical protein
MTSQVQHGEHKDKPSPQRGPAKPVRRSPVAPVPQSDARSLQRAIADPGRARPADILGLQRAAGNRAVTRLIQAKLTVGPAGDKYEQEADRVADQVMNVQPASPLRRGVGDEVQRQAEDEEEEGVAQTKPLAASITPLVQRQAAPEEEEEEQEVAQTKSNLQSPVPNPQAGFDAGPDVESHLAASRGSGSPLPDEVRAAMEPRFGADFGGVRVHTGGEADDLNRQLSAQAFTHGQDIYMAAGQYAPGTPGGNRLLAHELTHVIQQTDRKIERKLSGQVSESPDEGIVQRRVALAKEEEGSPDFVELTSIDYAVGEAKGPVELLKNSNFSRMDKNDVLFIVGHGAPGAIHAGVTKTRGDIWYDADEIVRKLFGTPKGLQRPIKAIRFTSCYAGAGVTDDLTDSVVAKVHSQLSAKKWGGVEVSGARGPSIKSFELGKNFTVINPDPQKQGDAGKIQKALEKIYQPRTKAKDKIAQQEGYIGRPLTLAEKGAIASAVTGDFYRDFVKSLQDPQGAALALQQKGVLTKDESDLFALLQSVKGPLTLEQAMTTLVSK